MCVQSPLEIHAIQIILLDTIAMTCEMLYKSMLLTYTGTVLSSGEMLAVSVYRIMKKLDIAITYRQQRNLALSLYVFGSKQLGHSTICLPHHS